MATALPITGTQQRSLRRLAHAPGLGLAAAVALYVALMPSFNPLPGAGLFDAKRLFEVGLLLGVGGWLTVSATARTGWLQTFYTLPVSARAALVGVVGIGCLSAVLAPLPRYAFLEVGHLALLFILAVTLAAFYRRSPETAEQVFLLAVVLSVLLYVARFYIDYLLSLLGLQYAFHGTPGAIWPNGEFKSFAHIRFLNQFQTWTLPLIVLPSLLFAARGPLVRWAYSGLAMAWWMLLFASGGRGTLLAVAVAAVAILLVFRRRALPWLQAQGVALVGGAVFYGLFFKVIATTNASVMERTLTGDSARFMLWERAWEMIQANPLLGAGPMHYAQGASVWAAHPHNAVLQWAAEWGVPAALLAVGLVVWGLGFCLWRFRREAERPAQAAPRTYVQMAVAASLVAASVHALLSGLIVMPLSQIMVALVVGWCWGMCCRPAPAQAAAAPRYRHLALVLAAAAAVAVVTWGAAPDAPVLKEREAAYFESEASANLRPRYWHRPRFWYQGYILHSEYSEQKRASPGVAEDRRGP